jgi:hypothetical protein
MLANSGDTRCPVKFDAEGQSRAKQEMETFLGVCNESGPTAKAKMDSVLTRNSKSVAEMTTPHGYNLP